MSPVHPIAWLALLAAAWSPAMAQPSPAAAASSAHPASASTYKSAFQGYRRFNDQAVVGWRDANDLVGRIGGWKAYAQEGQESEPPAAASPASAAPKAAAPPSSAGHSGHGMP